MSFTTKYIQPSCQDDKFLLMKFVYDNTDSFIMNTFGYLWEARDWWYKFPILVAYAANGDIAGIHAFTTNTKKEGTLKTYYIVTSEKYKKQGIAKLLTYTALEDNKGVCDVFYVNSTSNEGIGLYQKVVGSPVDIVGNEFGGQDYVFEKNIGDILKNAR